MNDAKINGITNKAIFLLDCDFLSTENINNLEWVSYKKSAYKGHGSRFFEIYLSENAACTLHYCVLGYLNLNFNSLSSKIRILNRKTIMNF